MPLPAAAPTQPLQTVGPKTPIDFKEFEGGAQDPFETLELKTLDDKAELFKVLSGEASSAPEQQQTTVPLTSYNTQAQQSGFPAQHSQPATGAPSLASMSQFSIMTQLSSSKHYSAAPTSLAMQSPYQPAVSSGWPAATSAQYHPVSNSTSYGRIGAGNAFVPNQIHGSQSFGDMSQISGASQTNLPFSTWQTNYKPFSAYSEYAGPARAHSNTSASIAATPTPSIVHQPPPHSHTQASTSKTLLISWS